MPPAISYYATRSFAARGGLIYCGIDDLAPYGRAASYVDRIFRAARKLANLPVQQPTKYKLVINLKTANVLGACSICCICSGLELADFVAEVAHEGPRLRAAASLG